MRILGAPQITNASISMTNISSAVDAERVKSFSLVNRVNTTASSTYIDLDFGADVSPVDAIILCGTNISNTATISVQYSSSGFSSFDATVFIGQISAFNQAIFLDTPISKRYWRIFISDPANTVLYIGYIYIGKYHQVSAVEFGHEPALNLFANAQVTNTGNLYGSKYYTGNSVSGVMTVEYDELEDFLEIVQNRMNTEPVVMVEYEESMDHNLYRPKYGILSAEAYPFSMTEGTPKLYSISFSHTEIF